MTNVLISRYGAQCSLPPSWILGSALLVAWEAPHRGGAYTRSHDKDGPHPAPIPPACESIGTGRTLLFTGLEGVVHPWRIWGREGTIVRIFFRKFHFSSDGNRKRV